MFRKLMLKSRGQIFSPSIPFNLEGTMVDVWWIWRWMGEFVSLRSSSGQWRYFFFFFFENSYLKATATNATKVTRPQCYRSTEWGVIHSLGESRKASRRENTWPQSQGGRRKSCVGSRASTGSITEIKIQHCRSNTSRNWWEVQYGWQVGSSGGNELETRLEG